MGVGRREGGGSLLVIARPGSACAGHCATAEIGVPILGLGGKQSRAGGGEGGRGGGVVTE